MSKSETYTSDYLYTKQYKTTEYKSTNSARQGYYSGYSDGNFVGIIGFSKITSISWSNKSIKKIVLTLKHGDSGLYGVNKTFILWQSLYQTKDHSSWSSLTGGNFIAGSDSVKIGDLTALCQADAEVTFTFSATENSDIFNKFSTALKSNVDTFCLYDSSTTLADGKEYSANYLEVTTPTITIEYDEGGIVYYGKDGEWKPCLVYYGTSSGWQQVIPYYGTNNGWQQLSG